jgi:hypothetical protein
MGDAGTNIETRFQYWASNGIMSILVDGGSAGMIGTITIISDMTMSITGPTVMRDSNRALVKLPFAAILAPWSARVFLSVTRKAKFDRAAR